jgi:hypothetical protein
VAPPFLGIHRYDPPARAWDVGRSVRTATIDRAAAERMDRMEDLLDETASLE